MVPEIHLQGAKVSGTAPAVQQLVLLFPSEGFVHRGEFAECQITNRNPFQAHPHIMALYQTREKTIYAIERNRPLCSTWTEM